MYKNVGEPPIFIIVQWFPGTESHSPKSWFKRKKQCWVSYVKISLSCQQLCNVLERGEVECGIETVLATCMLRLHTDTGVLIAPCKLWTKTKKCIQCSNTVWIVLSFTSTYCLYRDCKELNPKSDKHIAICCTSDRKTSQNSQWGSKTYNFACKKRTQTKPETTNAERGFRRPSSPAFWKSSWADKTCERPEKREHLAHRLFEIQSQFFIFFCNNV